MYRVADRVSRWTRNLIYRLRRGWEARPRYLEHGTATRQVALTNFNRLLNSTTFSKWGGAAAISAHAPDECLSRATQKRSRVKFFNQGIKIQGIYFRELIPRSYRLEIYCRSLEYSFINISVWNIISNSQASVYIVYVRQIRNVFWVNCNFSRYVDLSPNCYEGIRWVTNDSGIATLCILFFFFLSSRIDPINL